MIGRLLGTNTPAYEGQPQRPATRRGGLLSFFAGGLRLFPKGVAYAQPAPPEPANPIAVNGQPANPDDAPHDGGQPDAETTQTKRVTIIVTPGPGTTVDDVAAFFRDRCRQDD